MGVEDDRLLNLFHIFLIKDILTNGQLLQTKVRLQSIPNPVPSMLRNPAIENLQLHQGHMVAQEVSNRLGALVPKVRVPELQRLQLVIGLFEDATHLSHTVPVNVAVRHINRLDRRVRPKNVQQLQKVLLSNIILGQVDVLDSLSLAEGDGEMLNTDGVVE